MRATAKKYAVIFRISWQKELEYRFNFLLGRLRNINDITRLCRRVIIIDQGRIVYDGSLEDLVKQYARHKLLIVSFDSAVVAKEDLERYGEIVSIEEGKVVLKIPREDIKSAASAMLSSKLPVDDILINEMEIDDVIRLIFRKARTS